MKRPRRNVRQFGPQKNRPGSRYEIVRPTTPPELELPSQLTRTQRGKHIADATGDQYLAAMANELIAWAAQITSTEMHAISSAEGLERARLARHLEEQARQEMGEDDPFFLMFQDFNRNTLNDFFNHGVVLNDESVEVLRRVIADNPYFDQLPEERRGLLRRILDQFKE